MSQRTGSSLEQRLEHYERLFQEQLSGRPSEEWTREERRLRARKFLLEVAEAAMRHGRAHERLISPATLRPLVDEVLDAVGDWVLTGRRSDWNLAWQAGRELCNAYKAAPLARDWR